MFEPRHQFENSYRVHLLANGEIYSQRVEAPKSSGSGNEGNKTIKDGGMIRDSFPGINSPGQASVGHARGFSGVGGGGVLEPLAPSEKFSSPS